jgi:predicted DNA binding CopG/RHH family protein
VKQETKNHGRSKSRIPKFRTREQAARWFDTHDMADYQDEFKTVRAEFARNLSQGITIRLDPATLAEVRSRARAQGIGPTTLIRMWILERLNLGKS